jgi:cob(I)alamin adenosyltransferase
LEGGCALIQVYTGNGKGKTTAALGLAIRAAGAGLKVYIGQFVKGRHYSELNLLKKIKNIKVKQYGRSCFIKRAPTQADISMAENGLEKVKKIISSKIYDVVILDEINIALKFKLLKFKDITDIIKNAPKNLEIVLTGRYAPLALLKAADLISEVKEIKHYYKKGIRARKGIEF